MHNLNQIDHLLGMIRFNDTSKIEEVFNTVTQVFGIIIGIIGLVTLIHLRQVNGSQALFIGNIVYGVSIILMFLTSGLFHGFYFTKANRLLMILDHAAIFILIAGSFTPLNLALLHGIFQIISLVCVWFIALVGILITVFYIEKSKILLYLYLGFGWLGLILVYPIIKETSVYNLLLFLIGGGLFSLGTVFLQRKKLLFHHGIWHLFIIAGCFFHFYTIIKL
jgi:hemolysin III